MESDDNSADVLSESDMEILQHFFMSDSLEHIRLLQTHESLLLGSASEAIFRHNSVLAADAGEHDTASFLIAFADYLVEIRDQGPDANFRRLPNIQKMYELVEDLINADPVRMVALIETETESLLHPVATTFIRDRAEDHAQDGDARQSKAFVELANFLDYCRNYGLIAAFCQGKDNYAQPFLREEVADAAREIMETIAKVDKTPSRYLVDRQILICRRMSMTIPPHGMRPVQEVVLRGLAESLFRLGELTSDVEQLYQAELVYRRILATFGEEISPNDKALLLNGLGVTIGLIGELSRNPLRQREAEVTLREALHEVDKLHEPAIWAGLLNSLANTILHIGEINGDEAQIAEAVDLYQHAINACPRERDALIWAKCHNNLGNALSIYGELLGNSVVLGRAAEAYRAALAERRRELVPFAWAGTQHSLGVLLGTLAELTGDIQYNRQAEKAFREALLEFTKEKAPAQWASTSSGLGSSLVSAGLKANDEQIIDQAISIFREVMDLLSFQSSFALYSRVHSNLANALMRLGQLMDDADLINQSITELRRIQKTRPRRDMPLLWANTTNSLAVALWRFGKLTRNIRKLRAAEVFLRAVVVVYSKERVPMKWVVAQHNLCGVLVDLADSFPAENLLAAAALRYRETLELLEKSSAADQAQTIAVDLAKILVRLGRYDEAISVIDFALLRSDLAIMDASRSGDGRAHAVDQVGELYGLLSLCRLRQDEADLAAALVAAAAGRARLLADALALDALCLEEIDDPDVRKRIETARDRRSALRHRLGHGQSETDWLEATSRPEPPPEDRDRLREELRDVSDAYVALCREYGLIRSTQPLSLVEIVAGAPEGGVLVVPVLTETAAFAFIVSDGASDPAVIDPLWLDYGAVAEHLAGKNGWLDVYHEHFRDDRQDGNGVAQRVAAARWHGQLAMTMAWLWERLLKPVHDYLRDEVKIPDYLGNSVKLEAKAPVVLVAPGVLGLLPLHAAGPGRDGLHFCDHWTVSYAPSVWALHTCRQRAEQRRDMPAKLLAVIDPLGDLPGAAQEVPMLQGRFADGERKILWREQATLAAVLGHLPAATYVHASTHGWHDPKQPKQSGLYLADTLLRLEMLHETTLSSARLVFLSACESGLSGVRQLPDEFIGLPVGFVQAGAACVLGSLWPIDDSAAFLLANKFYELHFDDQDHEYRPPAEALTKAQEWLRNVTFGALKQMFRVQTGPNGSWVLLRATMLSDSDNVGVSLPLGDDKDRPFRAPEHWAAFIAMGA